MRQYELDDMLARFSRHGVVPVVKYLLDAGANVRAWNNYALQWASYNGHTEIVKILRQEIKRRARETG